LQIVDSGSGRQRCWLETPKGHTTNSSSLPSQSATKNKVDALLNGAEAAGGARVGQQRHGRGAATLESSKIWMGSNGHGPFNKTHEHRD
jgi:hypothetical protein